MRQSYLLLVVAISVLGFLPGCEDLELPFGNEAEEEVPAAAETPEPTQPAPQVSQAEPPPKPTAESVLAAIEAKSSFQVTDQDLQRFEQVESGLEVVTELNLKGVKLTSAGLSVMASLPSLTNLNLEGARISDSDWSALSSAKQLRWLSLRKSTINNESLEAINSLTGLEHLDISETLVADHGFVHMNQLSSLEVLVLNGLTIDGGGMQHLGDEGAEAPLKIIRAGATMFGALGFKYIAEFKALEELTAPGASVTDGSLTGLKSSNNLKVVNLGGNPNISDQGLKAFRRMNGLETLTLDGVYRISDVSLKVFGRLKTLKLLRLSSSACTPKGATRFKKAVPDCRLVLKDKEY